MKKIVLNILCLSVVLIAAKNNVDMQYNLPEHIVEKIENVSWIEDGPVALEQLTYVKVKYIGFDQKEYVGELIVHKDIVQEVLDIFKDLYHAKFPIEKIKLIDEYSANDDMSMSDNNTSALCVRKITGDDAKWSTHSYGMAVDINPIQNPYVKGKVILPLKGKEYLDRTNVRKGMIVKGGPCYKAFVKRGWIWGGDWDSPKDWMHFARRHG